MKAILKSNRKVIVDVEFYDFIVDDINGHYKLYKERFGDNIYRGNEIEFVEYYGG
jgi:hypothetical protein